MTYSAAQLVVARTIFKVGRSLNVPDVGIAMALSTGLVESGLLNVNHGDRDSLGVFQQRRAWGTAIQRMDVEWATKAFFKGTRNSTGWYPGLTSFTGWEKDSFRAAITRVQHPEAAYEHRYQDRAREAISLLAVLKGEVAPPSPPPSEDMTPTQDALLWYIYRQLRALATLAVLLDQRDATRDVAELAEINKTKNGLLAAIAASHPPA